MVRLAGVLFCLSRRCIRRLGVLDKSVEVLRLDRLRACTELSLDCTLEFQELPSQDDCGMSRKIIERIQSPPDGAGQLVSAAHVTAVSLSPPHRFRLCSGGVTGCSHCCHPGSRSDSCRRQLVRAPWGCCQQEWLTGQVASGGCSLGTLSRVAALGIFSWDEQIKYQFGEDSFFTGISRLCQLT